MRGLGKSMVVFHLFEKIRYSNERTSKVASLCQEQKYLEEENGKMIALKISPKIESLYGLGWQVSNSKGQYGILQLLQSSHLDNFPLKTLNLGCIAFHILFPSVMSSSFLLCELLYSNLLSYQSLVYFNGLLFMDSFFCYLVTYQFTSMVHFLR